MGVVERGRTTFYLALLIFAANIKGEIPVVPVPQGHNSFEEEHQ